MKKSIRLIGFTVVTVLVSLLSTSCRKVETNQDRCALVVVNIAIHKDAFHAYAVKNEDAKQAFRQLGNYVPVGLETICLTEEEENLLMDNVKFMDIDKYTHTYYLTSPKEGKILVHEFFTMPGDSIENGIPFKDELLFSNNLLVMSDKVEDFAKFQRNITQDTTKALLIVARHPKTDKSGLLKF